MSTTEVVRLNGSPERGITAREEFTGVQRQNSAETALAAVAARERALVEAQYLMSERHPRIWADVRVRILDHCSRPRFAEVSRYKKPVGKKNVNGEWVNLYAAGFTIRFAESLAQEMANVKPESSITFEDDLIRIMRIGVTDLQNNLPWSREVVFAKTVERKGKKKRDGGWDPPEGRDVISQRINSYGDPTFTVIATDDELRAKVNSEIAKTQRDFLIKLCPRDILEDCEDKINEVLAAEDKRDPKAAVKKWLDNFGKVGILPSDLMAYIGKPVEGFADKEVAELRELAQAIKEGASFQSCLKAKFDTTSDDEDETPQQRDARLQRQREEQADRIRAATESNAEAEKLTQAPKRGRPPKAPDATPPPEHVSTPSGDPQRDQFEAAVRETDNRRKLFAQLNTRLGEDAYRVIVNEHGGALNYETFQALSAAVDRLGDA